MGPWVQGPLGPWALGPMITPSQKTHKEGGATIWFVAWRVVQREALAAVRREAPVVTSDYYTSIPLLDKHAMTRQAFGY